MKTLIIIPTYNEIENIEKMIRQIFQVQPDVHILIVDDNSPDGTGDVVDKISAENPAVHLIRRAGKMGLGTAYVAGFRYALQNGYEFIFEMDADFSHDPKEIPNLLTAIGECDLVIGSRYVQGVNVVNWPLRRLILSYAANVYTKVITGLPLKDSTGGFKCFRKEVLAAIDLEKIKSNGYAFQIEMNFKTWKKGFRIKEIPIVFFDRVVGSSKMSGKIIREAVWMVWKLLFLNLLRRL